MLYTRSAARSLRQEHADCNDPLLVRTVGWAVFGLAVVLAAANKLLRFVIPARPQAYRPEDLAWSEKLRNGELPPCGDP